MSDANPFEKPVEASTAEAYQTPESNLSGPPSIPTSLMIISIIGLILGVLGLMGVCMAGAGLAMSGMAADMMPDEEAKVAFQKSMDLQFIPQVIQLTLSLIISPLLLIASIGCLTRKPWSQGLMKIAIIGSIVSYVLGLAVLSWMTLFHWDTLVGPNAGQPGGKEAVMIGQGLGFVFAVAFLIFFIWALFSMGSKKVTAFYDHISGTKR